VLVYAPCVLVIQNGRYPLPWPTKHTALLLPQLRMSAALAVGAYTSNGNHFELVITARLDLAL
jgi:hypothetical protein